MMKSSGSGWRGLSATRLRFPDPLTAAPERNVEHPPLAPPCIRRVCAYVMTTNLVGESMDERAFIKT